MNNYSIIIPTLNEELFLPDLLESIAHQEYDGEVEVIVVDGNSEDETVAKAETFLSKIPRLKVVAAHERGVSRQRNIGVEHASFDRLLFLDADIVLPSQLLNTLEKRVRDDEIVLVAHYPMKANILDYLWLLVLYSFLILVSFYKPICSGSFLLTSKKRHELVGGFDEETIMGGDVIYGFASMEAGARYRLLFRPYVFSCPRRLRKEGRIGLLVKWLRGYVYMLKHGPIYKDAGLHEYEFGNYTISDKI